MTEQIKVNCDYEALIALSYTAWRNIANYEIQVIETLPGYTKFKVNFVPLGELGTFEVKKDVNYCVVTFSNLSVIDNYDEWLKQTQEEINQTAGAGDDKMLLLNQKTIQKMKVDPEFHRAKQETWKETIATYEGMVAKLQSENRTYLTLPELEALENNAMSGDKNALRVLDSMAQEEGYDSWDSLNRKLWEESAPHLKEWQVAVDKEKKRREATPGVFQVWEYLRRMSKSEYPLHQAIADNIVYRDIYKIAKSFQEKSLDTPIFEAVAKPEKPKQKGRYRLTQDQIKQRKKIVKDANRIFRASNPKKTWKEIAYELDIPERTLRDWRHNPLY